MVPFRQKLNCCKTKTTGFLKNTEIEWFPIIYGEIMANFNHQIFGFPSTDNYLSSSKENQKYNV